MTQVASGSPIPQQAAPAVGGESTIKKRFQAEQSADRDVLNRARECAAKTKPHILPPENQQSNQALPESFQSIGALGSTNLEGKMLLALYPPDQPWFELPLEGSIDVSPNVSDEQKQQLKNALFLLAVLVQSLLETQNLRQNSNRRVAGFRSSKRMVVSQAVITGDALEQITDDFRIKVFRRDQYTNRRDSCGDILTHTIRESIDPLSLDDEQFAKSGLDRNQLKTKPPGGRMSELLTAIDWQPWSKSWVIRQEINDREINESEEKRSSPFISTPCDLVSGEHYGRGYTELLNGSLRACDHLHERLQHFAAIASDTKLAVDQNCLARDEDFLKPPGSVVRGLRVNGGAVQDVAYMQANKLGDFSVVNAVLERIEKNLGRAYLMESESTPRGERVTAFQVARVAMELDGAMGGLYTPIADYQQTPTVARCIDLIERQKLFPPLPRELYQIRAMTGIAALGRAASADKIMGFAQAIALLGPAAIARIDIGVFAQVLARYKSIHEPGLVKTDEQIAAETQAAIRTQAQMEANSKAIDVAGNTVENAATAQ